MIDNPKDVQSVKNALKHLEDLRTSMEDSGDWDGTYSDFLNVAGGNLKSLIYKYNEETHQYDGDPNPYRQEEEDERNDKIFDRLREEDD